MFKDTDFKTAQACSTGGVFNCVAVAITPEGPRVLTATRDRAEAAA